MTRQATEFVLSPFRTTNGWNKPLIVICVAVNGIVLANAILHDPRVGYDVIMHFRYVDTMAQGRLPTLQDTREFFSPPLPYALPAAVANLLHEVYGVRAVGDAGASIYNDAGIFWAGEFGVFWAGKFAQFLNVLCSLGLTLYLLKICDLIRIGDDRLKMLSLLLLGMLPSYYKTFAFVRGEPFLALFGVLAIYLTLRMMADRPRQRFCRAIGLGLCLGFATLSRQWGFFLLPAIAVAVLVLACRRHNAWPLFGRVLTSFIIAALVGGWFYVGLALRYGETTAFNRESAPQFRLSNQPPEFYLGVGQGEVFRAPIVPAFANQLLPIFHSELWGDYWCYFVVTGYRMGQGHDWSISNRDAIKAYLGQVNLVSLPATALLLAGLFLGLVSIAKSVLAFTSESKDAPVFRLALLQWVVLFTMLGYLWFLVQYPNLGKGDTIKASYLLQAFPFMAILSAELLCRMRAMSRWVYYLALSVIAATILYDFPTMITHYVFFGVVLS